MITSASRGGSIAPGSATMAPFMKYEKDDPKTKRRLYTFVDNADQDIAEYIGRELKIDLHSAQQKSLVDAMSDPSKWVKKRKEEMDKIKGRVAEEYQKNLLVAYNEFAFSAEDAQAYATRHAQKTLDLELEELEYRKPGASTIYQASAIEKGARDRLFSLANGEGELSTDEYRALKNKLRAAKAKRKASK